MKEAGFENVKKALVKKLNAIKSSTKTAAEKDKAAKEAGAIAVKSLWTKLDATKPCGAADSLQAQADGTIAATTHNRYVTRLRRDIEELGFISFTFFDDLNDIKGRHPKLVKKLADIDTRTYKTIGASVKLILDSLEKSIKKSKLDSTIKSLSDFAQDLKTLKTSNPVFVSLIRHDDERANMQAREEKRKVKYLKRQKKFYAVEMLASIYKMLRADDWETLTIGIAAATGRRCSEVVRFGTFSLASEREPFAIKFKGMRKSKNKTHNTYKIPSLVESKIVIDAIERLRGTERITSLMSRLAGLDLHDAEFARQINSSIHAQLGVKINQALNDDDDKKMAATSWVFKDTRALYARMSYSIYAANAKKAGREPMRDIAYFKDVLLHTDLNETLSYVQFEIKDAASFNAYLIKNTRKDGLNLEFSPRRPMLVALISSDKITQSRAYVKYANWCLEQLKSDDLITFTNRQLRNECGGRAETIGHFVNILEAHKLNAPNLIILSAKAAKANTTIRKEIELTITVSYTKTIEIEYEKESDQAAAIMSEMDYQGHSFEEYDLIESDYKITNEEDLV